MNPLSKKSKVQRYTNSWLITLKSMLLIIRTASNLTSQTFSFTLKLHQKFTWLSSHPKKVNNVFRLHKNITIQKFKNLSISVLFDKWYQRLTLLNNRLKKSVSIYQNKEMRVNTFSTIIHILKMSNSIEDHRKAFNNTANSS